MIMEQSINRVELWGQLAIQCCNHLHKGSRVHSTGRLQTRRWTDPDTGDVRLRTEIIASEVIFLGGIQQRNLPPAYGFELEDLPDIAGADDETHAQEDHDLNDTEGSVGTPARVVQRAALAFFVRAGRTAVPTPPPRHD